jgi:hypothetical protein
MNGTIAVLAQDPSIQVPDRKEAFEMYLLLETINEAIQLILTPKRLFQRKSYLVLNACIEFATVWMREFRATLLVQFGWATKGRLIPNIAC